MANHAVKQLREFKDWTQNAAEATLDVAEKLHLVMMRKPFSALEKIDAIAGPVHLLDRVQNVVSRGAFRSLRAAVNLPDALSIKLNRVRRGLRADGSQFARGSIADFRQHARVNQGM